MRQKGEHRRAGVRGILTRGRFHRVATWGPVVVIGVSVFLSFTGAAWAQCASPEMNLFLNHSIQVFRVGDFDPSDTEFHPHIFTVRICSDIDREVRLKLEVTSERYGPLVEESWTMPFLLEQGITSISNQELTEAGGDYELENFTATPEAEELEDIILATGQLPQGTYTFCLTLEAWLPNDFTLPPVCERLDVVNPYNLEILRPGAPFGEDLPRVLTAHPQFMWSSRALRWRFEIARAMPGDASGEDVMEHVPVYAVELGCDEPDPALDVNCSLLARGAFAGGAVNWNYPSSAEDLRRGRTYCWRVTALVETTGGTEEVSSEIYCFQRWGVEDLAAEPVAEALAEILTQLLDEFGEELEGMIPTGLVLIDGEAVDPSVVQDIMERISSGELEIVEMEIR